MSVGDNLYVPGKVAASRITNQEASALPSLSVNYIRRRKTNPKEVEVVSLSDGPMILHHQRTFYKPVKSAEKAKKKILADANAESSARGKTRGP